MGISIAPYLGTKAAEPVRGPDIKSEVAKTVSVVDPSLTTPPVQWAQATSAFADLLTKARQAKTKNDFLNQQDK